MGNVRRSVFLHRGRRRWGVAVLIALYLLGISGLPAGPGAIKLGCQCDNVLKASGNCCCAKSVAARTTRSCCATGKVAATSTKKSCCKIAAEESKKSKKNCCRTSGPQPDSVTACTCGLPSEAGYLLNTDPRLTSESCQTVPALDPNGFCESRDPIPANVFLSLETPPPRVVS